MSLPSNLLTSPTTPQVSNDATRPPSASEFGPSEFSTPKSFQTELDQASAQISIENYLKHRYVGKELDVYQNGKLQPRPGIITSINLEKDEWIASIWDQHKTVRKAKFEFVVKPTAFQVSFNEPNQEQRQRELVQRLEMDGFINSTDLIGAPGASVPQNPYRGHNRPIRITENEINYKLLNKDGSETNEMKTARFIIRQDKLYLSDGTPVMVNLKHFEGS